MAQGPLAKKFKGSVNKRIINKSKSNSNNSSSHGLGPKKGARSIAPKKQSLIKQKKMHKKLTAAINKNIEQVIASRAEAVDGGQKFSIIKLNSDKDTKKPNQEKNKSKK
ncbi:unnamed protein product [Rhizophagus irregularis]|uniref:Leydig cell tumor 10 kDa protein homolog n=3 Tax=Rhizophagus irregularis TaxID=588596 RepID=A0A2I1FWL9_9GLOM|nr:hypothetical protein GLOIN_2v1548128 [Rhizophagus irregularis DAOM 181602=DAOM 197198]EXX77840.1 hypothetical protein RirG_020100 [Rhizophagus irregularis DAOM 197198w]PKY38770.1 hypothetical protein RhiirA4_516957 [Rhizophagus irregularis]POG77338.1 hypothetical protein GLOIN_2v1548128 [Rhizophagus irregularis DAOM 181602=DAOM 197198]UZO06035.1 hypothetical protein OCT59_026371 [Rhizophagus irregularis]CAB4423909.1 unnamed protein product [Rhizophagus irregularis]|eukprot:XP_025184204.1 hypothetical protein GLOIN_2v1548128 [Rhizophagus irregularis DAOM 181602=DAOM 197198]